MDLVIVDIQPEYESNITFDIVDFVRWAFVEQEFNSITYLYNGPDLGMSSAEQVIEWLTDKYLEETDDYEAIETIVYDVGRADWFDKGYGFFRDVMDAGYEDEIVDIGKFMLKHDINDSRDIDLEELVVETDIGEHLLEELESELVFMGMPDVVDVLKNLRKPLLVGGGLQECLREVQLIYEILDIPYETYSPFTY
jgi:hypothetical protein